MSEQMWMERAQNAEAQLSTAKGLYEPVLDRYTTFKANFGIREKASGEIDIDFEKFAKNLGPEGWLELRKVGDEIHRVRSSLYE